MGVQERKQRERERRKNDILEAAHRSFESKGFLNTTLQDVAKEAEISVGLIYRYFQSKEDIFASLALKGAEEIEAELVQLFKKAGAQKKWDDPHAVLFEMARLFFKFYEPYGEYFDMLLYSYKGYKKVQIHAATLTRLMSVTLTTLDKIKEFVQRSTHFAVKDEDDALLSVFFVWGLLLGVHKLFDGSGRGHLFAFSQDEFLHSAINKLLIGIAKPSSKDEPVVRSKKKSPVEIASFDQ